MAFEVSNSVFRNAIFHGDLVNAKAAAVLDQMITVCLPLAIGFVAVRFGFRALQQALGRVFGHEQDGVLFNLQELAGAIVICVVISMFGALSMGLGTSVTAFNRNTKMGDVAAQRIQENYGATIDAHINQSVTKNLAGFQRIVDNKDGKYDAELVAHAVKSLAVHKVVMDKTGGGADGLQYQNNLQQLSDYQDLKDKDVNPLNPFESMPAMWEAIDFGQMIRKGLHSAFQGLASIIRQVVAAISLMGFQVMLCLGPLAFALEIFFRGTWTQWFKYTLALGLVNTVFNILDHFMDRNMNLVVAQEGWENAALTWEAVSYDITMIAMYIMAFRLIGKVIGDGSGGALSSKVITLATMVGGAAIAGAAYAPAMAGKGFKGMSDLKKAATRGGRGRRRRGMGRNMVDNGGE